jgi:glycosyltransferase involved in cell wall biosynthesis
MRSCGPHIGLNLIFLVPDETGGMEVYARQLIPALLEQAPAGMCFTAFVNREAAAAGEGPWGELLPAVTVPVNARNRVQWVFGEQALLPPLAARARVRLVHSLASTAPLWGPFKRVTTVNDLIYARFPDAHPGIRDRGMKALVPAAVKRSDRVIAISQSTRTDLIDLIGADPDRIDVALNGFGVPVAADDPGAAVPAAGPGGSQAPQAVTGPAAMTTAVGGTAAGLGEAAVVAATTTATRERYGLGDRPVVLSLSAKRPHKNLIALIEALSLIEAERRPLLVLPGYPTWHEAELRARANAAGVAGDVRFLGWISNAELEGLWATADAFVFPSLYEGFGLPVLEAMARGVPVACSNAASLPEVAGDAALLFDPGDRRAIAAAIEALLSLEGAARARTRARGQAQAERFTWRKTALATLDSYARALA